MKTSKKQLEELIEREYANVMLEVASTDELVYNLIKHVSTNRERLGQITQELHGLGTMVRNSVMRDLADARYEIDKIKWAMDSDDNPPPKSPSEEGGTRSMRPALTEANAATFPFRIFCDMDGVLVDLIQGIIDEADIRMKDQSEKQRQAFMKILSSGKSWQNLKTSKTGKDVLKNIFEILGEDSGFWSRLPSMEGASKLWAFISPFEPFILSHPWDGQSADGKKMWLSNMGKNLNPTPPQSRIILTGDKHKFAINKETGAPNVLIDDMEKYLDPWEAAGGIAIKHVSAVSSIRQLKAIMKKYGGEDPE